jgi:hypothetical protein
VTVIVLLLHLFRDLYLSNNGGNLLLEPYCTSISIVGIVYIDTLCRYPLFFLDLDVGYDFVFVVIDTLVSSIGFEFY